jgi:ankyrin repeat protein
VELLLEHGAQPDLGDKDGRTPLSRAAEDGNERIVELLLENGAQPDLKNRHGQTPLSRAIEGQSPAVVHLLLTRGVKTNYNYMFVSRSLLNRSMLDE